MKYREFMVGFLIAILTFSVYAAPIAVGKISFSKGSNAAQQPNAAPRLLGKDAEVYQGDNIQTSDASFVVVEFTDGSKVTIRPNSNFKIEQFDPESKNAKLTVYEGGVRATTGEFAKAGTDNFQIKTPTATVKGSKDSDYSVSVCKEGCDKANKDPTKDTSVAKVIEIKGEAYAQNRENKNENERKLTLGSGLSPKDFLTTQADSHLVMVFKDGEKVALHPNSEFDIVKYDFKQPGKKDQILFKLAAGGMRALTGSIGKTDHSAYALDTPVATIGIRGTENSTVMTTNESGELAQIDAVHSGNINVANSTGNLDLGTGQYSSTTTTTAPAPIPATSVPPSVTTAIKQVGASISTNSTTFDSPPSTSISNHGNSPVSVTPTGSNNNSSGGGNTGGSASSSNNSSIVVPPGESSVMSEGNTSSQNSGSSVKDDTPSPAALSGSGNTLFSPTSGGGGGCAITGGD